MIRRGEVYFVDLNPVQGRETAGRRPVLVFSDDAVNRQPLVITVVVGTDAKNVSRDYPANVRVGSGEAGLPIDTIFLCFQIRSLDPDRFLDPSSGLPRRVGALGANRMRDVENALKLVLRLGES